VQQCPERGGEPRVGTNTKLHAVTDENGRSIHLIMTAGEISDYIGAADLLGCLPSAEWLLGPATNRGYDADWLRDALKDKGIKTIQVTFAQAFARCLDRLGIKGVLEFDTFIADHGQAHFFHALLSV
jgi:transposase